MRRCTKGWLALATAWLLAGDALAQAGLPPIGTWRTHFPYHQAEHLAVVGSRVYSASEISLSSYDRTDNSLSPLTRLDGFAGAGISHLGGAPDGDLLFIGYRDGNMDLLREGVVTNVADAARDGEIIGSRRINDALIRNEQAYVSAGFGLMIVNLDRAEISESYLNLNPDGSETAVQSAALLGNQMFLATPTDVLVATVLSSGELLPLSTRSVGEGLPDTVRSVVTFNGQVYAATARSGIFRRVGETWENTQWLNSAYEIQKLRVANGRLLLITNRTVVQINENGLGVASTEPRQTLFVADAGLSADGTVWMASPNGGLYSDEGTGPLVNYRLNGPRGTGAQALYGYEDKMVLLHGAYARGIMTQREREEGFSVLDADGWRTTSNADVPEHRFDDIVTASFNPVNRSLYLGSFGGGLFEFREDGSYVLYDPRNSIIESVEPSLIRGTSGIGDFIRVSAVTADAFGRVWIGQHNTLQRELKLFEPDGSSRAFTFNLSTGGDPETGIVRIAIDQVGQKWMVLSRNEGLVVFDETTGERRFLGRASSSGDLPSTNIFDLEVDQEGEVWVGTDEGPVVFRTPEFALTESVVRAERPRFRLEENLFTILLQGEAITAVAVDGGNRKWLGTRNGAYLMSPDGSEQVLYFNSQNSPLPTDNINDIAINGVTGEVFFATDAGVVSYRGSATEATNEHADVRVFPNPIRPEYVGDVAITGLAYNAVVKITDVSGQLVYEMQANGGTAVWDRRDVNGQRAQTGIYLVFSATEDGEEAFVTKIAVVN